MTVSTILAHANTLSRTVFVLAAVQLAACAPANAAPPVVAAPQAAVTSGTAAPSNGSGDSTFATVNGLKLHYLTAGKGSSTPIVLLHGYAETSHMWRRSSRRSARARR